jgi:hypothetical protein
VRPRTDLASSGPAKFLWFLAGDDPLERLLLSERDAVEEAQCARHLDVC